MAVYWILVNCAFVQFDHLVVSTGNEYGILNLWIHPAAFQVPQSVPSDFPYKCCYGHPHPDHTPHEVAGGLGQIQPNPGRLTRELLGIGELCLCAT